MAWTGRCALLGALAVALLAAPASAGFGSLDQQTDDRTEPPAPPADPPPAPETQYREEAPAPGDLTRVDVGELPFDRSRLEQGPVHPYYTWYSLTAELFQMVRENPDIARLYSAGQSNWGFDLWVLEVANFHDLNKTPLDHRETLYIDGGTHANEQLGVSLTMEFAQFLVNEYGSNDTATWIVEERRTAFLPMVNPDGNHYDSRLNGRAVNINRNFPVGWYAVDENPVFNQPGPYPASEPETQAVIDALDGYRPDYVQSFHTGIELMLYPWGYTDQYPADQQTFWRICEEIGEDDPEFCGPAGPTIYPASGVTIDTAYERYGSVAWTYEVSDEQGLYASAEDPRERLERYWDGVMHAFKHVERYGAHLEVADVAVTGSPPDPVTAQVAIENTGYGDAQWAEVQVGVDGESSDPVRVQDLGAGNSTVATVTVDPASGSVEGDLDVTLRYPERVESPEPTTSTLEVGLSAAADGLQVVEKGLQGSSQADVAASEDAGDALGVPAPGLAAVVAASLVGAVLARRRTD
jgi:hypothetical protein